MMVLENMKIVDKDIWQVRSQHRIKKTKHKQTKNHLT